MLALIEHQGEPVTKDTLLDRIWPENNIDEANLTQNIHVLRKELRARWGVEVIETIPGRGYCFSAPACRFEHAASAPERVNALPSPRLLSWKSVAVAVALLAFAGTALVSIHLLRSSKSGNPAASPQVAGLYAIGTYYWDLRTRDGTTRSMWYFSRAVDADPADVRGYVGLALANAVMGYYGYGPAPSSVYFARASAYARKALAIDPRSADAYAVLGAIDANAGDLQHAVALEPSSAIAHEWYGSLLLEQGKIRRAYVELRRTAELDPLSVAVTVNLAEAAYLLGRYHEAISYGRAALDLSPTLEGAYQTLGIAYEARGDDARAMSLFRRLREICRSCRPEVAALLAPLYARTNHLAQARTMLAVAQARPREVVTDDLAAALAAMDRRAGALSLLRREHGPYEGFLAAEIASDPRFATLRKDWRAPTSGT